MLGATFFLIWFHACHIGHVCDVVRYSGEMTPAIVAGSTVRLPERRLRTANDD